MLQSNKDAVSSLSPVNAPITLVRRFDIESCFPTHRRPAYPNILLFCKAAFIDVNRWETHQVINADLFLNRRRDSSSTFGWKKVFCPADFQPFQRLAYAALTASEPFRTLMLIGIRLLLDITDELVGINLGCGFVPSLAGFKTLRPAAHAGFADPETMGRLFKA
jgi:hypothetical protein